jgi:Zinc carboxypeptidase
MLRKKLPELELIENIKEKIKDFAKVEIIGESQEQNLRLPIHKITFGNPAKDAPVLGLIGGVHGLERIGSQVCLALLHSLSQLYLWDESIKLNLQKVRVFFIPVVNPIGILRKRRSNPRGVDIMRNAPVDADDEVPYLLGGHRLSNLLPWYRGHHVEPETKALMDAVKSEVADAKVSIVVDFHSGFGIQDQIWFPYAKTRKPIQDLCYVHSLTDLLNTTYPNHFYKIEPQAYLTHGDVWDYLYDWNLKNKAKPNLFLPLCLEMGSWMWVKKNPMQIFSAEGPYNPVKTHRYKRALRRHNTFFEFLIRSLYSSQSWCDLNEEQKQKHFQQALELWYGTNK